MYGELIPYGGGDPIPLVKPQLLLGRRESCDIVLRFGNVSAHHCEMTVEHGYWFIRDLNSQNGTKVNGLRVTAKKRIDPGDRLAIAKHTYEVRYSPTDLGAEGPPPDETALGEILSQSLMKSAGLERRQYQERGRRAAAKAADDQFFDDLTESPAPGSSATSDGSEPGDDSAPGDSPTPPVAKEESADDGAKSDES
jgi:adenylate cyclase